MVAVDPPRLHGLDCQVEATDLPIESLGRGLTLANLVAFAFFPVFILKLSTIDCEHEHYSKIKQGPVSCVDSIGLPREVSLRGLPEF